MPGRPNPDAAVEALLAAHRDRHAIASLPEESRPETLDAAYRIQSAFADAYPARVAGFKIGAASAQSQALVGASEPFFARVFADSRFESPVRLSTDRFFHPGVEAELAFSIGEDLPPCVRDYDREEIASAIRSAHPAIEICDNRFIDWKNVGLLQLIADNGFYGALVIGDPIGDWRTIDLGEIHVAMRIDGIVKGEGICRPVLGDPLDGAVWLVNQLCGRGVTVRQGAVIAIGTWTGLHSVSLSQRVEADFGPHGSVKIAF